LSAATFKFHRDAGRRSRGVDGGDVDAFANYPRGELCAICVLSALRVFAGTTG